MDNTSPTRKRVSSLRSAYRKFTRLRVVLVFAQRLNDGTKGA